MEDPRVLGIWLIVTVQFWGPASVAQCGDGFLSRRSSPAQVSWNHDPWVAVPQALTSLGLAPCDGSAFCPAFTGRAPCALHGIWHKPVPCTGHARLKVTT